jgi:hypothetical protein
VNRRWPAPAGTAYVPIAVTAATSTSVTAD